MLVLFGCASPSSHVDFSGRYAANAAASRMLPGEQAPRDLVFEIQDDGDTLATEQTFTASSGERVRLTWQGTCDGTPRSLQGAAVEMKMSCRRDGETLVNTVITAGDSYTETCRLTSSRRLVCSGQVTAEGGATRPFSYAFDRL